LALAALALVVFGAYDSYPKIERPKLSVYKEEVRNPAKWEQRSGQNIC